MCLLSSQPKSPGGVETAEITGETEAVLRSVVGEILPWKLPYESTACIFPRIEVGSDKDAPSSNFEYNSDFFAIFAGWVLFVAYLYEQN